MLKGIAVLWKDILIRMAASVDGRQAAMVFDRVERRIAREGIKGTRNAFYNCQRMHDGRTKC